jgi:glycosyltransferase involved in cell wall biosynthesis
MNTSSYLEKIMRMVDKVEDWTVLPTDPIVSVWMITFNHEPFICQAIEGVLMQQTSFPFELVIGDDKSTDRTREIVKEYQQLYPDRIRLRLAKENLYSQKLKQGVGVLSACRGQYIAMCEGDDYWTDPLKLQKQVDFLETHPECAICFHNVISFSENGTDRPFARVPEGQKLISTLEDILVTDFIPTCSTMFRNHLFSDFPDWYYRLPMGDWSLHVLNAQHGRIGYIPEVMAAYRRHTGGIWSMQPRVKWLRNDITAYDFFNAHLDFQFDALIRRGIRKRLLEISLAYMESNDTASAWECLKKYLQRCESVWPVFNVDFINLLLRACLPGPHQVLRNLRTAVIRKGPA